MSLLLLGGISVDLTLLCHVREGTLFFGSNTEIFDSFIHLYLSRTGFVLSLISSSLIRLCAFPAVSVRPNDIVGRNNNRNKTRDNLGINIWISGYNNWLIECG